MNDEYVEEIHKIRENIYNQTKDMTPKELVEYYRSSSKEVRERVEEYRAADNAKKTAQSSTVAR